MLGRINLSPIWAVPSSHREERSPQDPQVNKAIENTRITKPNQRILMGILITGLRKDKADMPLIQYTAMHMPFITNHPYNTIPRQHWANP